MPKTNQEWTVGRLLETTRQFLDKKSVDDSRLTAEMLLAHALKMPRLNLYLDLQRNLSTAELDCYRELVRKAGDHHPVQYLIGSASFFSLDIHVSPEVLIPRPETETLVEQAISDLRGRNSQSAPRVIDLGTGSGCIAVAMANSLPNARIWATDISGPALEVARQNAERVGVGDRIQFRHGDLFQALSADDREAQFDLIVSNPPYIAETQWSSLPKNVRDHEPPHALLAGGDGLKFHLAIIQHASEYLADGGSLMLEGAFDQANAIEKIFISEGQWDNIGIVRDAAGQSRFVMAHKR